MRAAVTRELGKIAIEDVDDPVPGDGEVLVRIAAAGICRSDLTVLDGHGFGPPLPAVLGHEGAGIVERVGAGISDLTPGDHVVCSIVLTCGSCFQCLDGSLSLCEVGTRAAFGGGMMDGTSRLYQGTSPMSQFFCQSSFAELAVVPRSSVVRIRDDMPLDVAASLGCGAMTGIGAVTRRSTVGPMSSVVVIGAGGVGLSSVMAARAVGARSVVAVDLSPEARALACRLGATEAWDAPGFAERVVESTGRGADLVIDTVGTPGTLSDGFAATRPGGELVLVGLAEATSAVTLPMFGLCLQKQVTGTYAGSVRPQIDIPNAIELHLAGRLPLDGLVTRRLSLAEIADGFDDLRCGQRVGRSVVVMA